MRHQVSSHIAESSCPWKLPPELVRRIVFFIHDAFDLLAYIDAFYPAHAFLGHAFDHLWHLQQLMSPQHLWPHLVLADAASATNAHVQGMMKLYSQVEIRNTFDWAWLRASMNPRTNLRVKCIPSPTDLERLHVSFPVWLDEMARMRVEYLRWHTTESMMHLVVLLPRLPHLASLDIVINKRTDDAAALDHILAFLSDTISPVLNLNLHADLTAVHLVHLTTWLAIHPVHSFGFTWPADWQDHEPSLQWAFFLAITKASTLTHLRLASFALQEDAVAPFPPLPRSLETLEIIHGSLNPLEALVVASHVVASNIKTLRFQCCAVYTHGLATLLDALGHSHVTSLRFENCCFGADEVHILAQYLPHTTLA
ncbi:Aste57867_20614 [Aphanomyces stellatus]|uniref:Aste57867_20614 protein n=1 Tax=Aphanomyces stellatus TaxID=120398 RepID=A0A485LHD5_9STRA|nr:hypothetical protein As57867_020546 [Aphanomyces stellatus]VFT97294.1 Aste57867_20614 [Aphanomyces stellatus]